MKRSDPDVSKHFEEIASGVRAIRVSAATVDAIEAKAKQEPHQTRPFYATSERDCWDSMLVGMILGAVAAGLLVWAIVTSLPPRFDPCDVNRDGKVTAFDVLLVQRHVLGLEVD